MTRKIIPSILLAAAFLFTLLSSPIIADVLTEAQVAGKDVLFVVGVEERSGPSDDGLIRDAAEPHCEIDRARNFDALRKKYRMRREFMNTTLKIHGTNQGLIRKFKSLGFKVERS